MARRTTIIGTNVTVQTLSSSGKQPSVIQRQLGVHQLGITRNQQSSNPAAEQTGVINKVLLKCVSKERKSESKTFTIRNIDPTLVTTCNQLRGLIKAQLGGEVCDQFDVGYYQNNSLVTLRTIEDLTELLASIRKTERSVFWCDGLKSCSKGSKRSRANEDSDNEPEECSKQTKKRKRRNESETEERVKETIEELKQSHSGHTPMQYRIWAEMFVGGVHPSLDEPPKSTMFLRAGGGSAPKKRESVAEAVSQIAVALSPKVSSSTGSSPAKVIENRSRCYKQLSELRNLKTSGLLSDAEYDVEREAIMNVLKTLN